MLNKKLQKLVFSFKKIMITKTTKLRSRLMSIPRKPIAIYHLFNFFKFCFQIPSYFNFLNSFQRVNNHHSKST